MEAAKEPQPTSSSFFSFLSALPNGLKEEKKSAAGLAALVESMNEQIKKIEIYFNLIYL